MWLTDILLFSFFFFDLCFTAHQDYFTHFEPGVAKTGYPWEKTPDYPQAELGLSHMWPKLGLNPQRWDDERFKVLTISSLNDWATGATKTFFNLTLNIHWTDQYGISVFFIIFLREHARKAKKQIQYLALKMSLYTCIKNCPHLFIMGEKWPNATNIGFRTPKFLIHIFAWTLF